MTRVLVLALIAACGRGESNPAPCPEPKPAAPRSDPSDAPIGKAAIADAKAKLTAKHGDSHRAAIERGVDQVAALWRASDGDLAAFCLEQFVADPKEKDALFERLQAVHEQMAGGFNEVNRAVSWASYVDNGPMAPVDRLFDTYDARSHSVEDMFTTKVAFAALLNFPLTNLAERLEHGERYNRRTWAEVRLADKYSKRVPAKLLVAASAAESAANLYIQDYQVWMHHVVGADGKRRWLPNLRRLAHWELRHEIQTAYDEPEGILKQRTITKVMERIVTQTIPKAVIDNPRLDWNPYTNKVTVAERGTVENNAPANRSSIASDEREPDTRFSHIRAQFLAYRAIDAVSPMAPTHLQRVFETAEMPEDRVRKLLVEILESPLAALVAKEMEQKLGRKLEPHDIWYELGEGITPSAELDAITRKRYPTLAAYVKDVPRILRDLGFTAERTKHLVDHIAIDPARMGGHAWQAFRRGDKHHGRVSVEKGGMSYSDYSVAIHTLGHNVEEVFSLQNIDFTLLQGVPNVAFTLAIAQVFRGRALQLLGQPKPTAEAERLRVLDTFWLNRERAGAALIELDVWRWLYDHPNATAEELREATIKIAREVWNRYFAPTLGGKDSVLLAVYSHNVTGPVHLFSDVVARFIAFQFEELVAGKDKATFATEIERVSRLGQISPDLWMKQATGKPVSAEPLLAATARALKK